MKPKSETINIKVDSALKKQAQGLAKQMGLSLSSVLKGYLYHFTRTKTIHFSLQSDNEEPTDWALEQLEKAKEDIQAGRVTEFLTPEAEMEYLDQLIVNDKENKS